MSTRLLTFVGRALAAFASWHTTVEHVRENQAGAGWLVKQYHIQPLNYGSAVGASSAIISEMANRVGPAALTTRTAGPVLLESQGRRWAGLLHGAPLFLCHSHDSITLIGFMSPHKQAVVLTLADLL